jgi:methionine-rich copper-binding protein CopC
MSIESHVNGNVIFRRLGTLVLCSIVMTLSLEAHAILKESSPPPNGIVFGPDVAIRLKFNSRIDGAHSRIFVESAGIVQEIKMGAQLSPDILLGQAKDLKAGEYRLRWRALATDGHITRGEFPFTVR